MSSAARDLLLHPLVRVGSYGLAVAFLVQSFFDSWKWWIFIAWGAVFLACLLGARKDLASTSSHGDDAPAT